MRRNLAILSSGKSVKSPAIVLLYINGLHWGIKRKRQHFLGMPIWMQIVFCFLIFLKWTSRRMDVLAIRLKFFGEQFSENFSFFFLFENKWISTAQGRKFDLHVVFTWRYHFLFLFLRATLRLWLNLYFSRSSHISFFILKSFSNFLLSQHTMQRAKTVWVLELVISRSATRCVCLKLFVYPKM